MTERPGREPRRRQHLSIRVSYLGSRSIDQTPFTIALTLLAALTFARLLPTPLLVTWLITIASLALAQYWLAQRAARETGPAGAAGAGVLLLGCPILSGVAWGLLGLYVMRQAGLEDRVLMASFLCALSVYAATQHSAVFAAFSAQMLALSAPSGFYLFGWANRDGRVLGAAFLLIIVAILVAGWRHYQLLCRTARLEVDTRETAGVLRKLQLRLEQSEESKT